MTGGDRTTPALIKAVVRDAFPGRPPHDALPIGALYETFFNGHLKNPIASWQEITKEDMQDGHFGALLGLLSGASFVAWVPAWLVLVGSSRLEVPRALVSFAGSFSPDVSAETGKIDRLRDRVDWLDLAQRRAVAQIGRSLAADPNIIRYCGLDVGESIACAWDEYANKGFEA